MRTFILAAALAAISLPTLADTVIKSTRDCYSYRGGRDCNTEIKIERDEPPKPNIGYLPNFGGTAGGESAPRPETIHTTMPRSTEPAAPVDPKCRKVNACLKIY